MNRWSIAAPARPAKVATPHTAVLARTHRIGRCAFCGRQPKTKLQRMNDAQVSVSDSNQSGRGRSLQRARRGKLTSEVINAAMPADLRTPGWRTERTRELNQGRKPEKSKVPFRRAHLSFSATTERNTKHQTPSSREVPNLKTPKPNNR